MATFNTTCIAWIQTTACTTQVRTNFSIMCNVFLAGTVLTVLLLLCTIFKRIYSFRHQNIMFKIIVPHLMAWGCLQIFYHSMRGSSPHNFGVPSVLITMSNLISQSILGNTVLVLIIVWVAIHRTTIDFKERSYQIPYWITVITLTVLVTITSALAGINSKYYFVLMRITLALWIIYLLICIILLLIYGIQIYIDTKQSSKTDVAVLKARKCIPIMLSVLCGVIFTPVLVGFIAYASITEFIEKSSIYSPLIWGAFWTGSIIYVNIWSIYFWRSGNKPVE